MPWFPGAAMVTALVVGICGAAAAQLPVTANRLTSTAGRACTDATIDATVDLVGNLRLDSIPLSCRGLSIYAHTVVGTGAGVEVQTSASGASLTTGLNIALPLTVRGVTVLIDGWHIATRWHYASLTTIL